MRVKDEAGRVPMKTCLLQLMLIQPSPNKDGEIWKPEVALERSTLYMDEPIKHTDFEYVSEISRFLNYFK